MAQTGEATPPVTPTRVGKGGKFKSDLHQLQADVGETAALISERASLYEKLQVRATSDNHRRLRR